MEKIIFYGACFLMIFSGLYGCELQIGNGKLLRVVNDGFFDTFKNQEPEEKGL